MTGRALAKIGGTAMVAGVIGGLWMLPGRASPGELTRMPCWMGGPGVIVAGEPPAGWTPCGTSVSGWIALYVPSPSECLAPLTVAPGTPVVFVNARARRFDLDEDGDVDLADYAIWQNGETDEMR